MNDTSFDVIHNIKKTIWFIIAFYIVYSLLDFVFIKREAWIYFAAFIPFVVITLVLIVPALLLFANEAEHLTESIAKRIGILKEKEKEELGTKIIKSILQENKSKCQ